MEYINKGRPVYISFSEKDKGKVDKLVSALQNASIEFSYMYHNLPGAEKIAYEREIGFGEFVILVFGKDYFESWDCMYEFARVNKFKDLNSQKMVICLPFEGYKDIMNSDNGWQPIKDKWDHRKSEGEEDNGVKSLAKYYNYYGKEILRLPDYYKNVVRPERKDEDYQKLITQVKDFFRNHPTPITNSSEIFYKFDKDMWKNFVFNIEVAGKEIYMIPYIKDGLKDEDQVLFQAMIDDLIKDNIIQKNKAKKRLDVGGKVFLSYWNKKGLQLELNPNCSFDLEYYELSSEAVRIYNEKDTTVLKDCRGDFAGVFDNIFHIEDNNKGNTSLIS